MPGGQLNLNFTSFPPGHGRSVTDFSGWDAHEARLRCPDDVSGDIGGCIARRSLKPNFYYLPSWACQKCNRLLRLGRP